MLNLWPVSVVRLTGTILLAYNLLLVPSFLGTMKEPVAGLVKYLFVAARSQPPSSQGNSGALQDMCVRICSTHCTWIKSASPRTLIQAGLHAPIFQSSWAHSSPPLPLEDILFLVWPENLGISCLCCPSALKKQKLRYLTVVNLKYHHSNNPTHDWGPC